MSVVPHLDFRRSVTQRPEFIQELGQAIERYGFVTLEGHGLDDGLFKQAYQEAARVFALPKHIKQRYETPETGRQRGYTGLFVEHAKQSELPDIKEFWHVGRELPQSHPLTLSGDMPANHFPSEVPSFKPVVQALFSQLDQFSFLLLGCLSEYLGQGPDYFKTMIHEGTTVLRLIHYPEDEFSPVGAVRAAQHEDINLITLLPASTAPGLQILTREGEWLVVNPPEGALICDTGDIMAHLTGGRLPAVTHRVVNPDAPDGGRYSMPFFCHPHPDYVLHPMSGPSDTSVTARDFLMQRLAENGVL